MSENLSIDYNEYDCSEVVVNADDIKELEDLIDFTSVIMKVIGIVECLTIIGVIVGVPLMLAVSRLKSAKVKIKEYASDADMNKLRGSIKSIKAYFSLMLIISLIYFGLITFVTFTLAIFIFGPRL